MPNQQDQQAINGLFDRIEEVARKTTSRDRDAEALIQQRLHEYPPAPYYMAQTILIQEQALRLAQERIQQLEASQRPSGGFLGGLFGDDAPRHRQARSRGPWDGRQNGQGGGFLAGAAQTALGVTGGMLLGGAIAGMLAGDAQAQDLGSDSSTDQDFDLGGDDFDGSDFDIGGDF